MQVTYFLAQQRRLGQAQDETLSGSRRKPKS